MVLTSADLTGVDHWLKRIKPTEIMQMSLNKSRLISNFFFSIFWHHFIRNISPQFIIRFIFNFSVLRKIIDNIDLFRMKMLYKCLLYKIGMVSVTFDPFSMYAAFMHAKNIKEKKFCDICIHSSVTVTKETLKLN